MAGTDFRSKVIPSLIQGVSQQVAQARRDSQCEGQFDCVNSPADGVVPRPHFELLATLLTTIDLTDAWCYELSRGGDEHYLVAIKKGSIRVWNLFTGAPCDVTTPDGLDYLTHEPDNYARTAYAAQTVDDRTFIAAKGVLPALLPTLSPVRPKEALVFFRAGGYSLTYKIYLSMNGVTYTWAYLTPDNSVADNAQYIGTDQLAFTFYNALTNSGYNANSGFWYGPTGTRTNSSPIVTKAAQTFTGTATALGFGVDISGNLLRIYRTDGQEFTIYVVDGAAGQNLKAFKDTCQTFSDLPKQGFEGFTIKVAGEDKKADDDYFVSFHSSGYGTLEGSWQERVAPGIPYAFDPATMPYALDNTAPNTFVFRKCVWGTRVAGDAVNTALDPYFIGQPIQALFHDHGRLGILTESAIDWSKSLNELVWFPDTVQTELATAPISYRVIATGGQRNQSVSLLRQTMQVDEGLFAWAQRAQFRISSGQDPFKESTVEALQSTSYEFSEAANLLAVGTTVYFATEHGAWTTIRNLPYANGKPQGDSDITAHVPKFIPSGVTDLVGSDTQNIILVRSASHPNWLYAYNSLVSGSDIVQSAWNPWRLPPGNIIWFTIYQSYVFVLLQRPEGTVVLLRGDLTRNLSDAGHADYATRLDMRVDESRCTVTALGVRTVIKVPYIIANDALPTVGIRETGGGFLRGDAPAVVAVLDDQITVNGDLSGAQFFVGGRYSAERQESEFFLRSPQGATPADSITVRSVRVSHSNTGYYRVEVHGDTEQTVEFDSRLLGTATGVTGSPMPATGSLDVPVEANSERYSMTLINDSFLPSAWVGLEYKFNAVARATQGAVGGAGITG